MKKTFLLIALFLGVIFTGYSQDKENQVGIRGALNLSNWYSGDELNDENIKVGFAAGLFYRAYLNDFISLQPGLEFSQKGSTFKYNNFLSEGEFRGIINYVELPVLINIHPVENFHIGAGPYLATLISAKLKSVDDDGDVDGVEEFDRDNFTSFDYGVSFDAGLDFEAITVGARYNLGLNDVVWDTSVGDATLGKNSVLQIYLSIGF